MVDEASPTDSTSILDSIKKLLGIEPDYTPFDVDITIYINSAFSILHQIGAAPIEGFYITDNNQTWDQFLGNAQHVDMVKNYTYLKVRLVFDPPATSFALDAFKTQIAELEWRLSIMELEFNPHALDYQNTTLTEVSND